MLGVLRDYLGLDNAYPMKEIANINFLEFAW